MLGRIDYLRRTIEKWRKDDLIDKNEYAYLLACLIESVSFVSNTAGVYGAFLKHWDPRSKKPIVFKKVESKKTKPHRLEFYNEKIENIIEKVDCDILYLDPPYTQNQYGTQYHLLETLVLDDKPSISEITGSRPVTPMKSDWSKKYSAHILFDEIVSRTSAKYILLSYSVDGFLSKSFIEASLKRYGKSESYKCVKISYNKYTNFKSRGGKNHFEYLFFVEKKNAASVYYESPLNYIGSKAKIVSKIDKYIPEEADTFIDIFGGGFNVGINSKARNIIYNDINHLVKDIVESFRINDTREYLLYMNKVIKKHDLKKGDTESYLEARSYYNSLPREKRNPMLLYTIILYGFNQQIRFNSDHDFNNPVGVRWFNDKILEKMISFSRVIKKRNIEFVSMEFTGITDKINPNSFVYMDPPYRLTTGSYNDGKRGFNGWGINDERELFEFANLLNDKNIKFMISYIMTHKGKTNKELESWIKLNNYQLVELDRETSTQRNEIIIVNYNLR